MTKKINLFPSLIRFRETNRLKMAIAASIMLWCMAPQQAVADTYEKHEVASIQQQKVKANGTVVDQTGEPLIGVSVKVKDAPNGTITNLDGKFSIDVAHRYFSVGRFQTPVDDEQIAITNACIFERHTFNAPIKSGCRMFDEVFV